MTFQALRGTSDLLAGELARWEAVERTVRRLARRYGYQELRTPVIEDAALFSRSVGETSNIVQKEMFRFEDRGGREIVLRPEGTAAVVRAYLEHHLHKTQGFAKLFYLGPMFRAERPQAGRMRQFHQFGVEAVGSSSPWLDAEVITLCLEMLKACGLTDASLLLASMGCRADQAKSAERLRKRLAPHRAELCKDCQSRFDKNVFRVLDCKNPTCREIVWSEKRSPFVLCAECEAHFAQVKRALADVGIAFNESAVFARGLDYYTRTVFEVRSSRLGAQDAVTAGGRYDHLVKELGGPDVGAIGFAAGIERLLMAVHGGTPSDAADDHRAGIYVAVARPDLLAGGFSLVQRLRRRGVTALMDYEGRSLKAQFREADDARCQWVAILGEQELKTQSVTVKDLAQGSQRTIALDAFVEEAAQGVKAACHR
ncbi:MAG: histidine--tRNA ligase [Candidatus Omnitrophica bacterium]|nr:histidine--tRNA ligase [Candidatus Omnitrophota bacterium]